MVTDQAAVLTYGEWHPADQPLESFLINMPYGGIKNVDFNKQVPILICHKNMTYRATIWLLREELTLPFFFFTTTLI